MRITKAMLEKETQHLRTENSRLSEKAALYQNKVVFLEGILRGTTVLTIALEKVTDAVAHVITDLKNRR